MKLSTTAIASAMDTPDQSSQSNLDRPPQCFLPEGDSILRIYVAEQDGQLEWMREAWVFIAKGVGMFDGDLPWVKEIANKAKQADPERKWAWRYQAQRLGILKACFYELPDNSDPKYLQVETPTILVLNNTALKAFKSFMRGQIPNNLAHQLDVDEARMGIKFSLKRGSGAQANCTWDLQERALPALQWGDGNDFPHISQCFVKPGDAPSQTQKDQIEAELHAKISASHPESVVPF